MNNPFISGFIWGYLTCAAGLVVGWHVGRWLDRRKVKRTAKVDRAAATKKREDELMESIKAFCAVSYPGTSPDLADQGVMDPSGSLGAYTEGVDLRGYGMRYQEAKKLNKPA